MAMNETYAAVEPRRAEIDAMDAPLLLEFGNAWCGHCRAAQPLIAAAMERHPDVRHIKIADGPGHSFPRPANQELAATSKIPDLLLF